MTQQAATHSRDFRQVLEHLEQEAMKTQSLHEEQVQQITDSEQNALQEIGKVSWLIVKKKYCVSLELHTFE